MLIDSIYIIGSSGHAKVIIDLIEEQKKYNIKGIIDDFKNVGENFLGYEILGGVDYFKKKRDVVEEKINVIIAIGESKYREIIVNKLKNIEKIKYPVMIHQSAIVSKRAIISDGTIILANSIVGANANIGEHCILNHACCVDHDTVLHSYTTICPNVFIAGNVIVGKGSMIGIGTNIIEKINIGTKTYIGAGSCVIKDTVGNSLYFGNPAVLIKSISDKDTFFS